MRTGRQRVYAIPGGSLKTFLRGVNNFLRKHKVISNTSKALSNMGVPYASTIGNVASSLGYGTRRRRTVGRKKKVSRRMRGLGALSLPGGALRRTRRQIMAIY